MYFWLSADLNMRTCEYEYQTNLTDVHKSILHLQFIVQYIVNEDVDKFADLFFDVQCRLSKVQNSSNFEIYRGFKALKAVFRCPSCQQPAEVNARMSRLSRVDPRPPIKFLHFIDATRSLLSLK